MGSDFQVGGKRGELLSQRSEIDGVGRVERPVSDLVLFKVMSVTKRHRPSVRRLLAHPAARVHAHVRGFGLCATSKDATRQRPDPIEVSRVAIGVFVDRDFRRRSLYPARQTCFLRSRLALRTPTAWPIEPAPTAAFAAAASFLSHLLAMTRRSAAALLAGCYDDRAAIVMQLLYQHRHRTLVWRPL